MKIYRPKYCEDGCGREVKSGKRFIHGHNKSMKGKHHSKESKIKNSKTQIIVQGAPEAKEKRIKVMKLAMNRLEVKEKCSRSATLAGARPEVKERRSKAQIIAQNRPDVKDRIRQTTKITQSLPETGQRISKAQLIAQNRPEVKEKKSITGKITHNLPEIKEKSKQTTLKLWQNIEYCKKQTMSRAILPNKPEKFIMGILDNLFPHEWKYTGDLSFMIGGKNPDFVNINGQKKCIEHYGDWWHKNNNPQDRIDLFKRYGWDCLVIWEHELKDFKTLRRKIFDFAEENK
jgi:hypothetical protein